MTSPILVVDAGSLSALFATPDAAHAASTLLLRHFRVARPRHVQTFELLP